MPRPEIRINMQESPDGAGTRHGPFLYWRGHDAGRLHLNAILAITGSVAPYLRTSLTETWPEQIAQIAGHRVLRYTFDVPAEADTWYELDDERFEIAGDVSGDLRLVFVSCNGQEHGDLDRTVEDRNLMWHRLCDRHRERPFHLLLQGGDQLYADEIKEAHPLSAHWPTDIPERLEAEQICEVTQALREAFLHRYMEQMSQPGQAWISARVPSLSIWDDHDICDGWGSHKAWKLESDLGQAIFAAARECYLLFQYGIGPDEKPLGHDAAEGHSLTWSTNLPGLKILAPDLRSERRPSRVMGPDGWKAFETAMSGEAPERVIVLSSVPALGPRLSILERLMEMTPWMEKYEDDLRDQWQSYAHREEWQRFLKALMEVHDRPGTRVSVLSGEIHLATRGTMDTASGPMHQLVASGISHPAPPLAWAVFLGWFARLGEAPLEGHPIRLRPLPGQRRIYAAERNYLILERNADIWTAAWDLEDSGLTEPLAI
ncbi:MAG: alkaline phosphatase D family protein [Pseudomonadota bacterium]